MNVACPACGARYRIDESRIKGSRARITCKKCGHKFIIEKGQDQPAEAPSPAMGVPVRVQRHSEPPGGHAAYGHDEDNEDVPTTVMPHGSKVIRKIREATAEAPHPALGGVSGPPSAPPPSAPPEPQAAPSSPPDLRAAQREAQAAKGGAASKLTTYLLVGLFFLLAVVVATLVMSGALPLPG